MVPHMLSYFLLLSAFMFSVGLGIVMTKKNIILVLMGIELMLNAVNLNLVIFSKNDPQIQGQMFTIFVMTVAVCESVVALAITLKVFEHYKTIDLSKINLLKN